MPLLSRTSVVLATLAALGIAAARPALAQNYTYTTLDDPLATAYTTSFTTFSGTLANGINAAGQIVGFYYDATGSHGFLYSAATGFSTLDNPGTTDNGALGINASGQVVGGYADATGSYGYLYTPGVGFSQVNDPKALGTNASTFASGINDAGQIVGIYTDDTQLHGFLETPGVGGAPATFTDINDPDATSNTTARGINNKGQIVGEYLAGTKIKREFGYLYTPGAGFTTIATPSAASATVATSVNDLGQVAGRYFNKTGNHGFVAVPGTGGTPSTFALLDDPLAVHGTFASGINNLGQVVGYYTDANNVYHGFIATPAAVPEASSLVSLGGLLLLGAGGALAASRKRTKVI